MSASQFVVPERRKMILAILDLAPGVYRDAIRGAADVARAHGIMLQHLAAGDAVMTKLNLASVDGVLTSDGRLAEKIRQMYPALPVVCISNAYTWQGNVITVTNDDEAAGRLAARYFLFRGFRHFATVGRTDRLFAWQRCHGFVQAVEQAGYSCASFPALDRWPEGWQGSEFSIGLRDWLQTCSRPLALFHAVASSDLVELCEELGYALPQDVALVAGDNDALKCEISHMPLSSIKMSGRRIGRIAVEQLEAMMAGKAVAASTRIAPVGVMTRRSSDIFAVDDELVLGALAYIHQHEDEPIQVADVADALGCSRRSLERRVRKVLNRTVGAEIHDAHVECARRNLTGTRLPIERVAQVSGFRSAVYMAAVFRRQFGLSPHEYRQQYRESEDA